MDLSTGDSAGATPNYGNYIVEPTDPNYWSPVNEEIPLTVSDILMQDGKVAPFGPVADHALMGRFGNVV